MSEYFAMIPLMTGFVFFISYSFYFAYFAHFTQH